VFIRRASASFATGERCPASSLPGARTRCREPESIRGWTTGGPRYRLGASRLRLPVPLRPGLRVADGGAVGDVLPCPGQAASWGAADAQIRLARWQRDRLLALADGGRDPLHVADDARRV